MMSLSKMAWQYFAEEIGARTGRPLGRSFSPEDERTVAGIALTFSPPKTAPVLWALGDEAVAGAVFAAHEAAVDVAMAFLGDHTAFTRRGPDRRRTRSLPHSR